MFVVIQDIH